MSKKKNQNEDSIKNFKKAVSNFLSLLSCTQNLGHKIGGAVFL